jgi:hypothetical protein
MSLILVPMYFKMLYVIVCLLKYGQDFINSFNEYNDRWGPI